MTPNFLKAVELIFKHEGGLVDHPSDPGGLTNFGISQRAYPDLNIRGLSKPGAAAIYHRDYWLKIKGDDLPGAVALSVFDMAVNSGVIRSIKIMQRCLGLKEDGIIGPKTMEAVLATPRYTMIEKYRKERQKYYESLAGFKTFGKGWTRRTNETYDAAKAMLDA